MASSTDPRSPVPATNNWTTHEHLADTARVKAQQLVEEIGSVGLAVHAVEAVGEAMVAMTNDDRQVNLAKTLGFASVEELQNASVPVPANDGNHWFVTKVGDGAWAVWDDLRFQAERHFSDRDEALASVPHDDEFTGSSLLG